MSNDNFLETVQTAEFWRWVLKEYPEVPDFTADATVIEGCTNVFDDEGELLTLDIEERTCKDSADNVYTLGDYVAMCDDIDLDDASSHLAVLVGKYQGKVESDKTNAMFWFDSKNLHWYRRERKDSTDSKMVTNFNLIFLSVIKIYNDDINRWERMYEVQVEYMKNGRRYLTEIVRLTPEDTLNEKNFAKRIWELEMLQVFLQTDKQTQAFFRHLAQHYKPSVITQYDYCGRIKHKGVDYYITQDCLIRIPNYRKDQMKPFTMIAPNEQGAFFIENDEYIALDENLLNAPKLDLDLVDSQTGLYTKDMELIKALIEDDKEFLYQLRKVHDHICEMVSGTAKTKMYEGNIIFNYVFSYLLFDDMMKAYNHIIYMYIYGPANSGKGKIAEIILSFFGINTIASMSEPTVRALENVLSSNSKIPTWLDEFYPDGMGKKVKVTDQVFNTWFHLIPRNTSSAANRKRNEKKVVRSMVLFTSNYLPIEDHLNSRAIKIEYAQDKRGAESNYFWLAERRKLLQHLFIAAMVRMNNVDRDELHGELARYKGMLHMEATEIVARKSNETGVKYQIYDRQSEQLAAMTVVYNYLTGLTKELKDNQERALDKDNSKEMQEFYEHQYETLSKNSLAMKSGVQFLVDNAAESQQDDHLASFLSTVGYLVDSGKIYGKHYHWTKDGDLILYWSGIWEIYESFKNIKTVPKHEVRKVIAKLSENPEGPVYSWRADGIESQQKQRGYKISSKNIDQRFSYAFKAPNYTKSESGQNDEFTPAF
ncbi:MAG: hypothetical protein LAT57_00195 [Balneolales bacterium]|nr:hypothetical protein [Balneolales bacterium]